MSEGEATREPRLRVELVAGHGDALVLHWEPSSGESSTIVVVGGGPAAGGAKLADFLKGAPSTTQTLDASKDTSTPA
jgi:hypothetical protein